MKNKERDKVENVLSVNISRIFVLNLREQIITFVENLLFDTKQKNI
jgi:hypothetical protein